MVRGDWMAGWAEANAKAALFSPLPKAPAPLCLHYISCGKLQGLSDLQVPHLSEVFCGESWSPLPLVSAGSTYNWGPGRSIFKMKCLQLLGELSEGCGWDLGSSPQCLFTGCLGFLREEWLRSESQCPRNWHSVTSAIFHWSSNKAQIQGGEGSTLHYVS